MLHRGELFDVAKIRQGLESIGRLYGSKGYIDATPEPDTTVDDKNGIIDLLVKVDEGGQYHVRMVETHGLDLRTDRLLKSRFEPGQVFDSIAFRKFFDEQKAALPRGVSLNDAIHVRRDTGDASVDLTVHFRPCPHIVNCTGVPGWEHARNEFRFSVSIENVDSESEVQRVEMRARQLPS